MSLAKRSVCSTELATYLALPLAKSLTDASEGREAPFSTRFQSGTLGQRSVVTSKLVPLRALYYWWSRVILAPLACLRGGWSGIPPSSTRSLPCFLSLFLFSWRVQGRKTEERRELEALVEWEARREPPPHETLEVQGGWKIFSRPPSLLARP